MLVQAASLRMAGFTQVESPAETLTAGVETLAVDLEASGKRTEAGKMQLAMTEAFQAHYGCSEKEAALLALQIMSEVIKDENAMLLSVGWRSRGLAAFAALETRLDIIG